LENEADHLKTENFEQDGGEGEGEGDGQQPRVENLFARHRLHPILFIFVQLHFSTSFNKSFD